MKQIPLTQGFFALVDDDDFDALSRYKWQVSSDGHNFYAVRTAQANKLKSKIRMHRQILGLSDPLFVCDHIDGNGLNNCRSNLRVCSNGENIRNAKKYKNNTTGFKGVTFQKTSGKYQARVHVNKKVISCGLFHKALDAAKAYDEAAKKYHGEFAKTNF